MAFSFSRRHFLATSTLAALPTPALASPAATTLTVERRVLEVNGKPASVFGIIGPDGKPGLSLAPTEDFNVMLQNRAGEATIIHWHGQTPPPNQDGVTDTGYVGPISNNANQRYNFAPRSGTHWMHSHHGLQEQQLLAAPLIVHTAADQHQDAQEVVVLLHDFTFKNPQDILASLMSPASPSGMNGMNGMNGMMSNGGSMAGMNNIASMDLNDITFDAYLANDRTLRDPQIVQASPRAPIRLRLINAATATNFWIDLGGLSGQLIAVDGDPIHPLTVRRFPLAEAQRADILLRLPGSGAFPVLAQPEGGQAQTGIIIATPGAFITKVAEQANAISAPCDLSLETQLVALAPLAPSSAASPQRHYQVNLTGSMLHYNWGINGRQWANREPLIVKQGERVTFNIINDTMMAHPMHLHGHHFQVVAINNTSLLGAMRDTVLVPPMGSVQIAFHANNPGRWLFHCHNLYHMAAGMITEVIYA